MGEVLGGAHDARAYQSLERTHKLMDTVPALVVFLVRFQEGRHSSPEPPPAPAGGGLDLLEAIPDIDCAPHDSNIDGEVLLVKRLADICQRSVLANREASPVFGPGKDDTSHERRHPQRQESRKHEVHAAP